MKVIVINMQTTVFVSLQTVSSSCPGMYPSDETLDFRQVSLFR